MRLLQSDYITKEEAALRTSNAQPLCSPCGKGLNCMEPPMVNTATLFEDSVNVLAGLQLHSDFIHPALVYHLERWVDTMVAKGQALLSSHVYMQHTCAHY